MPSLLEKLNSKKRLVRGPDGQLVEETQENVQQLSQQAELAAPPITPLGTAMIGGNQDQQKMAGTPAQKQSAITIAQQPPQQRLADVLRTKQARTQLTAEEQSGVQKSQALQDLGQLGDRVHSFIQAQRQKLVTAQAPQLQAATTYTGASGAQMDLSPIASDLQALAANPQDMQALLRVNQHLGRDANSTLSPTEIGQLYQSAQQSIAGAGAQAFATGQNIGQLIQSGQLGYDPQQLSELIGIPSDQLSTMTVEQLQGEVDRLQQEEFNKTQELERKAQAGELGAAERALAREGAREASATGIRSAEAQVQDIENQISRGVQVSFGGSSYNLDQLLSSDTISNTITEYLNAAPGSPTRQQLEQSEPELVQFINNNQQALEQAAAQLQTATGEFQSLQSQNLQAMSANGALDTATVNALIPNASQLSTEQFDPNSVPVIAELNRLSPADKLSASKAVQQVVQSPELAEELRGLSQEEIEQLDLDNPQGLWSKLLVDRSNYERAAKATSPDEIITMLFPGMSMDGIQESFQQDRINTTLGLTAPNKSIRILDQDGDGQIDDLDTLRSAYMRRSPSLRAALQGQDIVTKREFNPSRSDWAAPATSDIASGNNKYIRQSLGADPKVVKAARDGRVDNEEVSGIWKSPPPKGTESQVAQWHEMNYLLNNAKLGAGASDTLKKRMDEYSRTLSDNLVRDNSLFNPDDKQYKTAMAELTSLSKASGSFTKSTDRTATLQATMNKAKVMADTIKAQIKSLQKQMSQPWAHSTLKTKLGGLEILLADIEKLEKQANDNYKKAAKKETKK